MTNTAVGAAEPQFNEEQQQALADMQEFLRSTESFFILEGPAGTGKTFTIKGLSKLLPGRYLYTAPTNKATKVLREVLRDERGISPECKTIHSALGLRMEANGEIKELAEAEDVVDLRKYAAVIVDEGSMISKQLLQHIEESSVATGVKFIFMGDPFQLPPVGERMSPIWGMARTAKLTRVMRHDNTILSLVTSIRGMVDHPAPPLRVESAHDGNEGVWRLRGPSFDGALKRAVDAGIFSKLNGAKVVAWRNVTVDRYNAFIRMALYGPEAPKWVRDDRITLLSPAMNFDEEPIAHTDDEGVVTNLEICEHPLYPEFRVWQLKVTFDDNRLGMIYQIHDSSKLALQKEIESRKELARMTRSWNDYWKFVEAFHNCRHAYATTAHRSQGSTYDAVFVDLQDILLNRTKPEAMRCLYVACSRPRKQLFVN